MQLHGDNNVKNILLWQTLKTSFTTKCCTVTMWHSSAIRLGNKWPCISGVADSPWLYMVTIPEGQCTGQTEDTLGALKLTLNTMTLTMMAQLLTTHRICQEAPWSMKLVTQPSLKVPLLMRPLIQMHRKRLSSSSTTTINMSGVKARTLCWS